MSDIRFRMAALFQEAGITIPYPQRDLHLDTRTPLQVQVSKEPDSAPHRDVSDGGGESPRPGD